MKNIIQRRICPFSDIAIANKRIFFSIKSVFSIDCVRGQNYRFGNILTKNIGVTLRYVLVLGDCPLPLSALGSRNVPEK